MVILPNDRVLLLTQERIKTMSDTKISLNNEAARIKQIIEEKEKKRNFTEPAAIPSFDREIRQLKRQLQNVQEAIEIQARESEAGETQLDEITKAKTLENKLYEEAVEAGIDFNNHDNPMLVSIHRLGLSIELVDILTDAANLDKEREEKFPDIWYFIESLNNAIAAKEKCVIHAKEKYDDAEQKKMEIEKKLQASKENGDVENIIILTDQLEDAKKVVQCLKELLSAEEEKPALSAGDSLAVWEKVCGVYGYEWRNRLQEILLAAQIYHENLQQLDELNKNLWLVRKSIQNIGEANGDTDVRIKGQKITCNLPDLSKVMSMDEEARLMSTVFFRRGEML